MSPLAKPSTEEKIDAYIAAAPESMREPLKRLRNAVKETAPEAEEVFSYGMVGFKYRGKPLVYLGSAKKHYALYGYTQAALNELGNALSELDVDKGTIRFSPDGPVPEDLVRRIVQLRTAEIDAVRAKGKGRSNARN